MSVARGRSMLLALPAAMRMEGKGAAAIPEASKQTEGPVPLCQEVRG